MPAPVDNSAVEGDNVALLEHALAGYAVHYLFVHRRADGAGEGLHVFEGVVSLEGRYRSLTGDELVGEHVKLCGGHARLDVLGQQLQGLGDDLPRLAHQFYFAFRFEVNGHSSSQ